jgi:hypothetical protein
MINYVLQIGSTTLFMLIDTGVLLFALLRVRSLLQKTQTTLNLPYTILHITVLVLLCLVQLTYNCFEVYVIETHYQVSQYLLFSTVYHTGCLLVMLIMCIILYQVSGNKVGSITHHMNSVLIQSNESRLTEEERSEEERGYMPAESFIIDEIRQSDTFAAGTLRNFMNQSNRSKR